jgi:hypothetical protein
MSKTLPSELQDLLSSSDWSSKLSALQLIQQKRLILPELTLNLGSSLLKSYSWQLGESYWEVCEYVFYASLDCQAGDWLKVLLI